MKKIKLFFLGINNKDCIINIVVLISFLFTALPIYFMSDKVVALFLSFFIVLILAAQIYLIFNSCTEKSQFYFDFNNSNCKTEIASFMLDRMNQSGSIAIFSRDLSWVEKKSHAQIDLEKKAERGELTVFLQNSDKNKKDTKIIELINYGAEVYFYNEKIHPRSRFTILNYKQAGAEVMIGLRDRNFHIIKIINSKENLESFSMVIDYLEYLEVTSEKIENEEGN